MQLLDLYLPLSLGLWTRFVIAWVFKFNLPGNGILFTWYVIKQNFIRRTTRVMWNFVRFYSMLLFVLPREPTPHFLVNLTWDAVKGCWVSTCLGDPSEQLLGGQLLQYAAQKKWRPFFQNGRHFKLISSYLIIVFERNILSPCEWYHKKGN